MNLRPLRSLLKTTLSFALLSVLPPFAAARGASTINSTNAYSWGANFGWVNWQGDWTNGASIGAYIAQGYIYGANVGWISLGNGNPANHIQYANNSATDFGVNFTIDANDRSHGLLRGYRLRCKHRLD